MNTFTNTRKLRATPSAVFAAMRDPVRLARWWGPSGFSNRFDVFEFRPGGRWVFDMIGPDGKVYPNESVFLSIEADRQVVIQHTACPISPSPSRWNLPPRVPWCIGNRCLPMPRSPTRCATFWNPPTSRTLIA